MFGLMTKAAHKAALKAEKRQFEMMNAGKVEALESQIADLNRLLKKSERESAELTDDAASLRALCGSQRQIINDLTPDAEKWRAKVAKDKAYEANRPKRVRKSRAKGAAE